MDLNNGTTGNKISFDTVIWMSISAFTAVAWYNVIELNLQVFLTFKRHRGLYFWSLIISSYGCIFHSLGFLLKFFQLTTNDYLSVTIITIGWYAMVTGQSIVLYSRLHLVVREQRILRAVLIMIIADALCLHIPTTVLTYGSNSHDSLQFTAAFDIMERIQMTGFCIQEFIISGVYVWSTISLLRPVYHGRTRKVMMQLIWINLMIIGMDIVLLIMEYDGNYEIEATLKAMVYSIKLKLEFAVLNQLMNLANSSVTSATRLTYDGNEKALPHMSKGRSKSLSYLSRSYTNTPKSPPPARAGMKEPHRRSGSLCTSETWSSLGPESHSKFDWIPALDRKQVFDPEHIEHAGDPNNVFTNPAAFFGPNAKRKGTAYCDSLGDASIEVAPDVTISPTMSGSTLNQSQNLTPKFKSSQTMATTTTTITASSPLKYALRRARAPARLNLSPEINPTTGVLRSNRPSVCDWALDPDSEGTPPSSDNQINPFDVSKVSLALNRAGGPSAPRDRNMGLDFMTSAI